MSRLPFPERVLHQHIATLGKTGSGKSSAMRVIAEHLLDKQRRVAIIDPKGDWWGLKSAASGKSAGYPVIMFGDFKEPRATDVPINDRSGKDVAELIATGNRPCVLGFRGWMPAQLVRFWLEFAPTLFNANEGELYVIIDEVHNFAPKGKIMDPDSGKCLHWTNRIMSEGRGLGLTFFIASQRPQKVHNDTLDNCETLIAMRVTHPRSREATEEWINAKGDRELGKQVLSTLAELKRGEAWVWSPENDFGPSRVQFPMFQTFDSFAPPQLQKKVSQAGWSEIDLDQVKEKLSAVIAEAKANDPKELKAQVAQLRQELAKKHVVPAPAKSVTVVDQKATERAIAAALKTRDREWLTSLRGLQRKIEGTFAEGVKRLAAEIQSIAYDAPNMPAIEIPSALVSSLPAPAIPRKPIPLATASDVASSNGALGKGEKEILLAAAQCHPADRGQLSILTGYKRSTRNRYIQFLQSKGYVEDKDEKILPTPKGMAALGPDYTPLPTGRELQQYWLNRLGAGEKHIFAFVLQHVGEKVNREAIGEATGYQRSTRNRYIQFLQSRQLLKPGSGPVEPAEMLFNGADRKYG
jgi:DNA segregation ATPase FtsK/SpoIIIE-like protein